MIKDLEKTYSWEGLRKDVENMSKAVNYINKISIFKRKRQCHWNPIPIARSLWEKISIDVIDPYQCH